jgi:hypothetical protein
MHKGILSEISNFQIRWGIVLLGRQGWQINSGSRMGTIRSAENRTKDTSSVPHERHYAECSRLMRLFHDHLSYHRSYYADVPVK